VFFAMLRRFRSKRRIKPSRGHTRVLELFEALKNVGGVQPHASILDIGCSSGHFADEFRAYLLPEASFVGMDVRPSLIESARKRFAKLGDDHSNFQFLVADVFNTRYNPTAAKSASDYQFPFEDDRFDFVYGLSLFTHMLPNEVGNYLSEARRVMKPGGRCFFTYLLLNEHSEAAIRSGYPGADVMRFDYGDYRTRSEEVPEAGIAIKETVVRALYGAADLKILEPIHYGSWSDRPDPITRQDIIVAER
jgi:SAM-dependent methyltransferase